jgi:hypothetical protein
MFSNFVKIAVSPKTKLPLIKWGGLEKTPDMSQIFKKHPDARLANLAGKINDIIISDIDKPKPTKEEKDGMKIFKELVKNNEKTLTFKTKSGRQCYFKYDDDIDATLHGVNG